VAAAVAALAENRGQLWTSLSRVEGIMSQAVAQLRAIATVLSPLEAYELAERQKRQLGVSFRSRIIKLYQMAATQPEIVRHSLLSLPEQQRIPWPSVCRELQELHSADEAEIWESYRALVMRFGIKRVDPRGDSFLTDLNAFYQNHLKNFPLPEEQETLDGFRALLEAPARADGYQEQCYSVFCPLTGAYIMGLDFTIQPTSNSVHFVYGFVNPIARGIGRFSKSLLEIMKNASRPVIADHLRKHPEQRPAYYDAEDPIILFEKNAAEDMSLTDILMDSAAIDIDHPPVADACLASSAIGQHIRDLIWHRCGGRIVDYNYLQPSLDGVVAIDGAQKRAVIAYLNRKSLDASARSEAESALRGRLGRKVPGSTTLQLCVFAAAEKTSLPTAQIRDAMEIYQGISIVKDPGRLADDIYFQAQMASLAECSVNGRIPIKPIPISGSGATDFLEAEEEMKRLLSTLSWEDLRRARRRSYREWRDRRLKIALFSKAMSEPFLVGAARVADISLVQH
jgi:hypothetical protein